VRELCVVEEDDREHDRGEAARPEPAQDRQGRRASAGSQHRERDRQHPHDGQAEDRIEHDLPGHLVQQRAEDYRPENDEGHRVEQLATLVDEVGHLTGRVASQRAEQKAPREGGDEDAVVHDRMPVVLDGVAAEEAWLNPEVDLDAALELVRPLSDGLLDVCRRRSTPAGSRASSC
jgi:hypothetical protein